MPEPKEDAKNVYTEDQHVALCAAAVERETSSLQAAKTELETQTAAVREETEQLKTKLDTAEAETASEKARADAAEKALEDFKNELAELAAIEARKADRVKAVKAANESLKDEYFTAERAQRWAEMSDESFEQTVTDIAEAAKAAGVPSNTEPDADKVAEQARETAAFKGGDAVKGAPKGSALSNFFKATGHLPAGN